MTPSFKPWCHCCGSGFFRHLLLTWKLYQSWIILLFTVNFCSIPANYLCLSPLNEEVSAKLELMRYTLTENGVQAIRLRGTDWFSWATAGASHTVLVTAETGVAEVLVTAQVTDEIEAQRLKDEELPRNFQLHIYTSVLGLRVSSVRLLSLTLQMAERFSVIDLFWRCKHYQHLYKTESGYWCQAS